MHEKPRVTPKDFFLWAGSMLALYVSVFSFLALFFEYIDRTFPDALYSYFDPYSSGMRFSIASLLVLFPLYLLLMRLIRADQLRDPSRKEIWVRRWMLVLTIFLAGAGIAGSLISLVNSFLGGEITMRFFLKVTIVLLVASAGLMHFLADMWGYWFEHPNYARRVGWGVGVLVVTTIASSFLIMGTPGQIRLHKFDDQKVQDLQGIQSEIVYFWQTKQRLPNNLAELQDSLSGVNVTDDPQTGENYIYRATGTTTFFLCANFNSETQPYSPTVSRDVPAYLNNGMPNDDISQSNWYHPNGTACFDRRIDPQRYPPIDKTSPVPPEMYIKSTLRPVER
jgi:hypothetical protein